jgi:hypothetical protein
MRYAFLLLFVAACEGCATVSVPPIPYDTGKEYLARTGCDPTDERKVTSYEPEYDQGSVMHDEIRAHEMMHQEQITRYGCQVWLVIYRNDAGFRLRSEAEAMCAQVPVAMARYGMTRAAAVDRYAGWLLGAYPQEVQSFANARGMIQYYCEERT